MNHHLLVNLTAELYIDPARFGTTTTLSSWALTPDGTLRETVHLSRKRPTSAPADAGAASAALLDVLTSALYLRLSVDRGPDDPEYAETVAEQIRLVDGSWRIVCDDPACTAADVNYGHTGQLCRSNVHAAVVDEWRDATADARHLSRCAHLLRHALHDDATWGCAADVVLTHCLLAA